MLMKYRILERLRELLCYLTVAGKGDDGERRSLSELQQVPGRKSSGQ